MISKFDKQNLGEVRAAVDAALKTVCTNLGISLSIGMIRYTPLGDQFTTTLTGKAIGKNSEIEAYNKQNSAMLGYSDNIIGKEFCSQRDRKKFKVIEIHLNRPKWPIIAEEIGGPGKIKLKPGATIEGVTFDRAKCSIGYY